MRDGSIVGAWREDTGTPGHCLPLLPSCILAIAAGLVSDKEDSIDS